MALNLTDNLKQDIKSPEITPSIVAKIDGVPFILGNVQILEYIRIGDPDLYVGNDWRTGGLRPIVDQKSYLSFDNGTTTKISQKIDPSKGVGTSVSQMTLALNDSNAEMTELITPDKIVTDILGRRITVFSGTRNTSFPQDYNVVFRGVVQSVSSNPTTVFLNLNSTEEKKRVSAFPRVQSETAAVIHYKSVQFQDILFKNKDDVQNLITINYLVGGTAGSETITLSGGGYAIDVQIQNGASTAAQIKKAIENSPAANQLVVTSISGNSSNAQFIGSTTLGTDASVSLVDASQFLTPTDCLETFISCENELIQYTGKSGNNLTGCVRVSNPSFHALEKTCNQVIKLSDNGINLALKLMLSGGPTYYASNIKIQSIEYYTPLLTIDDAIFFPNIDLKTDHGVVEGDLFSITGSPIPANNVVDSIIVEVGLVNNGSYIIISDAISLEGTTVAVGSFKSQFNKLPIGFAMLPNEVDIDQHIYVRDTFLPTFPMAIYTKEISDGKSFLEKQIYVEMNCIAVQRKGQSSVVFTVGPLPSYEVVQLNTSTVENPEQLKVERSINENFINQVQYDYDYDPITEKFLTRKNYPDQVDTSQINVLAKPLLIQSQGLRTENDGLIITERAAAKWLNRYQRGAEYIKGISVPFSFGFALENGDITAVDYSSLKLSDYESGTRTGAVKLMEIQNIQKDFKAASVILDVVNTVFGVGDRYGLISPSSKVGIGSTTTKVILQKSWSTKPFHKESKKWTDGSYTDQSIIIHNEDWTIVYETSIRGFDNNDPQGMLVDELPASPLEGFIIQCPEYPNDADPTVLAFWKQRHAFFSPRVAVTAGVSNTRFTVASGDVSRFFIGSIVRVHNYAFTVDSPDVTVVDIIGNDILVDETLGFIPTSNEIVDLIGFPDKQQSYRVV